MAKPITKAKSWLSKIDNQCFATHASASPSARTAANFRMAIIDANNVGTLSRRQSALRIRMN
jgi:hypothetical protein